MEYADPQNIEGELTVGAKQKSNLGEPEFNTLDEPIRDTIVSKKKNFLYNITWACEKLFIINLKKIYQFINYYLSLK